MKNLLLILVVAYFAGCTKQERNLDSKNPDSLQQVINSLKSNLAKKNEAMPQSSAPTQPVQSPTISSSEEQKLTTKSPSVDPDIDQWKKARNGKRISIKWKLKVYMKSLVYADCIMCYLGADNNRFVDVFGSNKEAHSDDIIIVTGETMGVSDDGAVKVSASSLVNKGIE